ncbi:hypothetical protein BCR35DRAFT_335738 [Leucosporidium creatinivorum]|uniref:Uncharacterized protein n=1 Tax=Leucosporidium creatinivorum TaxID=106004 RepID=A0A1Y2D6P8_9BASI|nr:hypothetical protein BCR35DRAFT_335738 [Leucosporidium creatinivorum]
MNNTHPIWWKDAGLCKLNLHLLILLLGSYTCGFNGSVMNSFFGIESFMTDVGNPNPLQQGLLTVQCHHLARLPYQLPPSVVLGQQVWL